MTYKNPNRDTLKEDTAREHFEAHVLLHHPLHMEARKELAVQRLCKAGQHVGVSTIIEEVRKIEEELFQAWYEEKSANGFAQFGDPFCVADGY